jgi:hypothetical protein
MLDSPPITWFTENPTPILVAGGMMLVLLAVFFLKSGRVVLFWPAGAVLAFMGLAVLVDKLVVTDREQVQNVIYDAARAAEQNHLEQVIDCISPSATRVRDEAHRWIGQAKLESVTIAQMEVTVDKSKQPFTAVAHFWVRAQGTAHTETAIYRNYLGRLVVDFRKEGDRWLVTGYQRD